MKVPTDPIAQLHLPVLRERCLDLMAPAVQVPNPVMIDATLGMGGHTAAALERFPQLRVFGIDRDPQAIELASRRLASFGDRFQAFHTTYDSLDEVAAHSATGIQVILMDLGVSSLQLDEVDRGFSYARDAALDMRMDPTTGISAAELLADIDEAGLRHILFSFGEEKFASRIAHKIILAQKNSPILRTGELADLVRDSIPAAARRTGGNPAKRTFQALRIAVNAELDILAKALPRAVAVLPVGGRIIVESYQSLEDKLVKNVLSEGYNVQAPPDLPVVPAAAKPYLRALTRGAEKADETELTNNPRAAAVRLRAAERIRLTPSFPRRIS